MLQVILVGFGGFLGAAARYLVTLFVHSHYTGRFPLGTFLINLTAAMFMGFLSALLADKVHSHQNELLFLTTGVLGGFSTLSALSLETVQLFESGHVVMASLYCISTMVCCLAGILLGRFLASLIHTP